MKRILYLECFSGVSGSAAAAALVDLCEDRTALYRVFRSLQSQGIRVEMERENVWGQDACRFSVLFRHSGGYSREEAGQLLDKCDMSEGALATAKRLLDFWTEAEAKLQGVSADRVSLGGKNLKESSGEVLRGNAKESVAHLIAAAVCLDALGMEQVIATKFPAESERARSTPLGNAIIAAIRTSLKEPDRYTVEKTGVGVGSDAFGDSCILRARLIYLGERDMICKLETNIDDCSGEVLGITMELLFAAGARDVHYIPVFMKKNRPAYQLNVICSEADREKMEQIIFQNTTTIGIRRLMMERTVLEREMVTRVTSMGEIRYKVCQLGQEQKVYPEYESIAEICRRYHMSYEEAYDRAVQEFYCISVT